MIASLRPVLARFSPLVFPPACWACGAGRSRARRGGVCPACWDRLPRAAAARCRVCDLPIAAAGAEALEAPICGRCMADPPGFDALRCPAVYEGSAREILKAFKYGGVDYLAPALAAMMAAADPAPAHAVVVPVPATRRERRGRAFFPAAELAAEFARATRRRCAPRLLEKTRETERQAGLPLARRAENVRGAFRAGPAPADVLLVDDVATSGATLSACARALKRRGAARVDAVAFARALPEAS